MADYMPATLYVGGCVTRAQLEAIRELAEAEGDPELTVVSETEIKVESGEARWGEFEALEEYLRRERIPFDRFTEAKYDYNGMAVFYRPAYAAEPLEFIADQEGRVVVTADDILWAIGTSSTYEELVRKLRAMAAADVPPLPPLEVVE